ncbi:hypothetical protein K504DRAFT_446807 [Pleomassaria siparia CBS 279.74]|uniref:Uncharacterized protein n=1 Tax=Pleomassaria siparia CBS 279.74 TaxID=1314801 RepID=A0A6G1K5F4_9PLEO|nr:hypothetical protein K504DRAFT_446807 [Pleomassaria siparia CBS 279.74]
MASNGYYQQQGGAPQYPQQSYGQQPGYGGPPPGQQMYYGPPQGQQMQYQQAPPQQKQKKDLWPPSAVASSARRDASAAPSAASVPRTAARGEMNDEIDDRGPATDAADIQLLKTCGYQTQSSLSGRCGDLDLTLVNKRG